MRWFIATLTMLCITSLVVADDGRRSLADKHAPAGIMGDHIHNKGAWMVEYKYMNMYMEDNRIGEQEVSDADSIGPSGAPPGIVVDGTRTNAGASPTDMTMEMHMAHIMYGMSDDVTLYTMIMMPSLTMDHIRGDGNPAGRGTSFTTHNSGLGDTNLGALLRLYESEKTDFILNLGGSVPTGDIYRESSAPTGGLVSQPLPYPMRLGSGTFNARPGFTAKRYGDWWSSGIQVQTDIPIGRNYRGYSVSDEYRYNSWTSVLLTDWLSVSLRGEHIWRTDYDGNDNDTTDALISTNVESFRGGKWYNLGFGMQAIFNDHYLSTELISTVEQNLDGIQLESDFAVVASWSRAF
ncbi:MAG: transporter [Pirellulaceae bacterium]